MKNTIIIFTCILLLSCNNQKITLSPFVAIYKSDWVGNIYPNYLFLKTQPEIFEIYSPGVYSYTVGQWNISNDTLFLFPNYEFLKKDSELLFLERTFADSTVTSIPQQFLIKKDCLIDITDYSVILPDFIINNKTMYQRVNSE